MLPQKTPIAIYKKARKMGLQRDPGIEFLNRSAANRGEHSGNWKGGSKKTSKGYIQILMPEHPRADRNGYVFEHIVVFERETGIEIPPDCCIHHINGNKSDNSLHNLCMIHHTAHTVMHHLGSKRNEETKTKISESRRMRNVK